MDLERRYIAGKVEARASEKGKQMVGYAAMFNVRSVDLGGFFEVLAPGAFDRAIREAHDVRALVDHNSSLILGRTVAGTLRLSVDGTGLAVEADLPDTQAGRDIAVSMERGDVTGMSFQFRVMPEGDSWQRQEDGTILRTVTDLELYDVGPVTFPAYPQTTVSARSLQMVKLAQGNPKQPMERLARELRMLLSA